MRTLKIFGYIFALLAISGVGSRCMAQTPVTPPDSTRQGTQVRGIQYQPEQDLALINQKPIPLFAGISVSGDLAGAVMAVATPFGQYEAACRINLKERYFPIFEMGWGTSDHTDETTLLHYKTGAPYFRIGCDYNFAKDRYSGNRIMGGVRYGFSSFNYDIDSPGIEDPIWGTVTPFDYDGVHGGVQWAELVFGLEAKIWSIFHIGWTARYRFRLHNTTSDIGSPWYVPGYGRNEGHVFSGTFNIIFDI